MNRGAADAAFLPAAEWPGLLQGVIMKKGDRISTPRFLWVTIQEVYENETNAREAGYTEPTHYKSSAFGILGKSIGINRMVFAAFKKI